MATTTYTVKLGLTGLTSDALVRKGENNVTMLTGNPSFPTLATLLPPITAACDALVAANEKVLFFGGKIAYVEKHLCETTLRNLLKGLGEQVQVISGGDLKKITSAGFEVRKQREPINNLDAPQNMRARIGALTGQILLNWDLSHGAHFYQVMMTKGDPTLEEGWSLVATVTRTKHTMKGLETGKFYSFRVNAIGATAESGMSGNASSMAA